MLTDCEWSDEQCDESRKSRWSKDLDEIGLNTGVTVQEWNAIVILTTPTH